MGYGFRDGDILALENEKAGALTLSQPLHDFKPASNVDPFVLWESQPAVRTVIGFIARSMSSIPFDVYQGDPDGGKVLEPTHRVHQALHRPWPKHGQGRFLEALVNDLYVFGRWAFLALPDGQGGLQFPKLKANRFSVEVDGFGRYTGVSIWNAEGSGRETIPVDDVVFDLGPEPTFGTHRTGSTAVTTLEDLAQELGALGQYRAELFENSARVPAVIERPATSKWSDDAYARFKAEFSTYRAGGGNSGGTPILEDGMTYKPIDVVSPREAQYIDVRKLALEEAAEALHVPPELVGARQGTYSNILALREQLYQDVLGPLIRWTEEALNAGLAHLLQPGEEIRADVDSKLRTDQATRAKINQIQVGRPIQTVNEARAERGWPAVDGGDELIVPLNVSEGGLASPADTGRTNEGDPESEEMGLGKAAAPEGAKATTTPSGDKPEQPEWSDPQAIAELTEKFQAAMHAWGVKAAARWRDRLGLKLKATAEAVPALDPAWRSVDIKELIELLMEHMPELAGASSEETLALLEADPEVWSAQAQVNWLTKAAENNAAFFNDQRVYTAITGALSSGDWGFEVGEVLEGLASEAEVYAVTVGTEAVNFGAWDAAHAAGATHKTWWTTSLKPRKTHQALSGTTIPIDEEFPNRLRYPGDWTGEGPETANCRCRLEYSYGG